MQCLNRNASVFFIVCDAILHAGVSPSFCLSPSDAVTRITNFGNAVSPSLTVNLTPNRARGIGAAFMKLSYPTDSPSCSYFGFSSSFSFYLIQGDGINGQGFTFAVVLNSSLGEGGSQLGYGGGIGPGFAVEFDTSADSWDPPYRHIGINVGRTAVSTVTQPASFLYDYNGLTYAWVDLDPVSHTLSLFISKKKSKPIVPLLSTVLDLCKVMGLPSNSTLPPLYAGFTSSANDAAYGTNAMFDWSISTREWFSYTHNRFLSHRYRCHFIHE